MRSSFALSVFLSAVRWGSLSVSPVTFFSVEYPREWYLFSDLLTSILEVWGVGLALEVLERERESAPYGALRCRLGEVQFLFRVARMTPRKEGHFVTVWKRPYKGDEIEPFGACEGIAFLVVAIDDVDRSGYFIFDATVLVEREIFSSDAGEGKRALRVYAPWISVTSLSARRTQVWQQKYFVETTYLSESVRAIVSAFFASACKKSS